MRMKDLRNGLGRAVSFGRQQGVNATKIKKALDGGFRSSAGATFRVARRNKLATAGVVLGATIVHRRRKESNRRKKIEHANTFYNNNTNYNRSFSMGIDNERSFAMGDKYKDNSEYVLRNIRGKKRWARRQQKLDEERVKTGIRNKRLGLTEVAAGVAGGVGGAGAGYYGVREVMKRKLYKAQAGYAQANANVTRAAKSVASKTAKAASEQQAFQDHIDSILKNTNVKGKVAANGAKKAIKLAAKATKSSKEVKDAQFKAAESNIAKILAQKEVRRIADHPITPKVGAVAGGIAGAAALGLGVYAVRNKMQKKKIARKVLRKVDAELDAEADKEIEVKTIARRTYRRKGVQEVESNLRDPHRRRISHD